MQKNRKSTTIPEKHNFLPTFLAFLFPEQYLGIYNSHNSIVLKKKKNPRGVVVTLKDFKHISTFLP